MQKSARHLVQNCVERRPPHATSALLRLAPLPLLLSLTLARLFIACSRRCALPRRTAPPCQKGETPEALFTLAMCARCVRNADEQITFTNSGHKVRVFNDRFLFELEVCGLHCAEADGAIGMRTERPNGNAGKSGHQKASGRKRK
jgi:hypothetical protein